MILSDKEIRDRLIQPERLTEAKEWWEKGDWSNIENKIIIHPFEPYDLGSCCYDLHVGEEYISLRDPYETKKLGEDEHINIEPGETVLILTQENICLPKNVMAMIVPRATWIFEGTALCATRIEPTWYGKLLIAFLNLAKNRIALVSGEKFCTCYFMEVGEVEKELTRETTPHLGRTKIGAIKFIHARPQPLIAPEAITRQHLQDVAETYGTPWDIVRGAFELSQKEIVTYVEKEVAPDIVQDATSAAIERAFETQQRWIKILITGLLTILVGFIGLIGYLIYHVLSSP